MKGNNRLPHSRGSALSFGRRIAILSAMPRRESTPPTNAFRRNAAEGGAVRSGRAVAPLSAPAIGAPVTAGTMGGANAPSLIDPDFTRDILESAIPRDVLDVLLADRTTGGNILWMSENYTHLESVFDIRMGMRDEIDADVVSRPGNKIIRPRVDKSKAEQKERIQKKAEVFTPSWICNHALAEALNYMNVIEQWGSGLRRVSEELAAYGAKPLRLEDGGVDVRVNVFRNAASADNDDNRAANEGNCETNEVNEANHEVNAVNQRIVLVLSHNPKSTIPEMARICNVSRATIDRAVKVLKDSGRIRRVGGTRGHWEVLQGKGRRSEPLPSPSQRKGAGK